MSFLRPGDDSVEAANAQSNAMAMAQQAQIQDLNAQKASLEQQGLAGSQAWERLMAQLSASKAELELNLRQRQGETGMRLASESMGESGRRAALGETAQVAAKLRDLIGQGGVLSQQQLREQASRETGQAERQLGAQEAQTAQRFAGAGILNPAAVAAATAQGRAQSLGMGARAVSAGERENAQTLPSLLGAAGQVGAQRAGLQAQTSWEQVGQRTGGMSEAWAQGRYTMPQTRWGTESGKKMEREYGYDWKTDQWSPTGRKQPKASRLMTAVG